MEENLPYKIAKEPWHESVLEDYKSLKSDAERNHFFCTHGVDKRFIDAAKRVAFGSPPPEPDIEKVIRGFQQQLEQQRIASEKAEKKTQRQNYIAILIGLATLISTWVLSK